MSINYTPELVKLLMDERLDEARKARAIQCCQDPIGCTVNAPARIANLVRTLFRRPSPAASAC
jgi:hypothetical protein